MFNPDLTLACMDLSKMDAVEAAMDKLLGAMTATLNNGGGYQLRAEERAGMKTFGASSFGSKGWSLDLVDMGDFAKTCQRIFRTKPPRCRTLCSSSSSATKPT